jgi:hypothetical protein
MLAIRQNRTLGQESIQMAQAGRRRFAPRRPSAGQISFVVHDPERGQAAEPAQAALAQPQRDETPVQSSCRKPGTL